MSHSESYKCDVCGKKFHDEEKLYRDLCTIRNISGGGFQADYVEVHICTECCEKTTIAVLIKRLSKTFNDSA